MGVDARFLGWLFEIRQTLEPLACATAALRRTPEQLKEMHKALQAMYGCESSRQGFTKADLAFHQAILEASGNPFLQSIGSVIGAALATSFTISSPVSSDDRFNEVMRQHQAVFDAIEQRDPSVASDAMSALILQAAERVQIKRAGSSLATVQTHAFSSAT
jgi:DNA-binding FadR family transcriptional regulator